MHIFKENPNSSKFDWNRRGSAVFLFLLLVLAGCSYSRETHSRLPDLRCPTSPNCVSTQANDPGHRADPFPYSGNSESTISCLKKTILNMTRSRIVEEKIESLRAEFRSRIFRFVDDAEFRLNKAKSIIEFRSASRVGYYDFGVNRQRMEKLRIEFRKQCK